MSLQLSTSVSLLAFKMYVLTIYNSVLNTSTVIVVINELVK